MNEKTICVDFDGVIHLYRNGWQDGVIYDKPTPGAIEWLVNVALDKRFKICIYSSRSKNRHQLEAMKKWIDKHTVNYLFMIGSTKEDVDSFMSRNLFNYPIHKPAAWVTIDDRAICFTGIFPSLSQIESFKPWNI